LKDKIEDQYGYCRLHECPQNTQIGSKIFGLEILLCQLNDYLSAAKKIPQELPELLHYCSYLVHLKRFYLSLV
jgi:hypothetical protein